VLFFSELILCPVLLIFQNKENFTGCIADVTLNDEKLGLLASKIRKTPCKDNWYKTLINYLSMID
jgi:hypothetical protein